MVDLPEKPERDALAAELALGLLDGTERAQALRLCLADPGFADEVNAWNERLSPLLDTIPAVTPPPFLWEAVAARIGQQPSTAAQHSLRAWRGGALISGAIAASLALFIAIRPVEITSPASVAVSQLAATDGTTTMAVAYDPQKGVLRLSPQSLSRDNKSPELWVIPGDGVPRSLGIIGSSGAEMTVGPDLRHLLKEGVTLAITLEDAATAPHRAPSGAPILTGKISII